MVICLSEWDLFCLWLCLAIGGKSPSTSFWSVKLNQEKISFNLVIKWKSGLTMTKAPKQTFEMTEASRKVNYVIKINTFKKTM